MKNILVMAVGALGLLVLTGCGISLAADVTPPPNYTPPVVQAPNVSVTTSPVLPPDIANGKIIYQDKCQPCHGENGMGDGVQAAQLPVPAAEIGNFDLASLRTPAEWFEIISVGNIERFMPGFQSLSDRERWNVTAYILSMSMNIDANTELAFQENCASCHAAEGDITDFSEFGKLIELSHADLVKVIQNGNDEGMPGFGDTMPATVIDSLASYVRTKGFQSQAPAADQEAVDSPLPDTAPDAGQKADAVLTHFSITGRVSGLDEIPDGVFVRLNVYDMSGALYQNEADVDEDGQYVFPQIENVSGQVYQVTTIVDGISYSSEVLHDVQESEVNLPILVSATTTDNSALFAERMHVFFDFIDEDSIQVVELFVISNPSDEVIVPASGEQPVLEYKLPEGAENLQFEQGSFGTRYIATRNGFGDLQPVEANTTNQIIYAYEIPYQRNLDLTLEVPLPVNSAIFMLPSGSIKLESSQLSYDGTRPVQGMDIQTYSVNNLARQSSIQIRLSGRIRLGANGEASSMLGIILGASMFGMAVIFAIWMFRKKNNARPAYTRVERTDDLDGLLDAVIALDDAFKNGEIPEGAYHTRRAELISTIREVKGGQ